MPNSGYAINGIGNYYMDPYFMAAYNYNPLQGLTPEQQQQYLQQLQQAYQKQQNPSVMTQQTKAPEKKKNGGKVALVLGSVALVGAGLLCHHKGNPDLKFFQRLGDGFKVCKEGTVNWCKNAWNSITKIFKGEQAEKIESLRLSSGSGDNPIPLNYFRKNVGRLDGEKAYTMSGEGFTGQLLTNSGKVINFLNGTITPAVV